MEKKGTEMKTRLRGKPMCSKIEINYLNVNSLKENNGRKPEVKTERGQAAVSFTKFVSDINIRQKKLSYKF